VTRELDTQRRAFERLQVALAGRNDVPRLALGQEIWAPDRATARRIARHPSLGLGGTDYLLVEFGFDLMGDHVDVIETVLELGYRIVVAHPERYSFPSHLDPMETVRRWRELGAHLQVNVGSLTGHYRSQRPRSEAMAWQLVESGLAGLLSTDHHGPRRFGVSPREGRAALVGRGLERDAERLMSENPGRIVRGETELEYAVPARDLASANSTQAT
jgi:protein-tyrosine phosphatase